MLQVGAGKVSITPTADMLPFPNWESTAYEGVFSDCYCKCIYLDNGRTTALVIGFDLGFPPVPDVLKQTLADVVDVPVAHILLSATHNHTGAGVFSFSPDPEAQKKSEIYKNFVIEAAKECAKLAKASKTPAMYGFGEGSSHINTNRDKLFEDGYWMQSDNPTGYSDKTVAVMKFTDLDGQLICALANYAMHAVTGFISPDVDGKVKIAGNVPAIACDYAENRFDCDAVILWTSGAAGNQNPLLVTLVDYAPDGYAEPYSLLPGCSYALMRYLGQTHGIDIIRTINSITCTQKEMPIVFESDTLELPAQKAPEGADMAYNRLLVDNLLRMVRGVEERPEKKLVEMVEDPEHPVKLPVQMALLGDVMLFGAAAELYNEIGRDCKLASPMKHTMVITHTDHSVGYILDKTSKDKKVFQSYSPTRPGMADELIVAGMLRMYERTLRS